MSHPTALVMLALDERDASVVETFLSLAPRLGLQRVVVLHVHEREDLPEPLRRSLPPPTSPQAPPELERQVDALRAALPDVELSSRVAAGSVLAAAAALQEELAPDLLVLGRAAFQGGASAWSPVGLGLVRHARCDVLVAPRGWLPPARGAVVGLDFSDQARAALAAAVRLFDDVACLYQVDPDSGPSGARAGRDFAAELERNAQSWFQAEVLPAVGGGNGLSLEVVPGRRAADALLRRASPDRVLVIGSRGLSPLAAILLGSTAERVSGRADTPVLIVRKKGQAMGLLEGLAHR